MVDDDNSHGCNDCTDQAKNGSDNAQEENDEESGGIFVNLTVPPGAEAGVDSLTFVYGGNELEILVPAGSVAGDVLRIQVGFVGEEGSAVAAAADNNDEVNDAKSESKPSSSSLMDELGGIDDEEEEEEHTSNKNNCNKRSGGLLSELGGMKDDQDCSSGRPKDSQEKNEIPRNAVTQSVDGNTIVELGHDLINGGSAENKGPSLHLIESLPGTHQQNEGDGTNRMVWSSGAILAQALSSNFGRRYLNRFFQRDAPQRDGNEIISIQCLELGSGLGVCGLALAHALASCCINNKSTTDNAKDSVKNANGNVLLTDQGAPAIDLLKENIQRNLPPSCVSIAAESLVWGNKLQSNNFGSDEKCHIVLGSDLLYNTRESYEPLIQTIQQYLHPEGIVLLAVRWRKPDLEREFFQKAETGGLKFELWKEFLENKEFEKRSPCQLSWRDYGNPESEVSNAYFHETTMPVGDTQMSLAKVFEEDNIIESMKDEEYSIFEELQVQVYIGKYNGEKMTSRKRQRDN